MIRNALVQGHRWVGLALGLFLIPAALTGSALVWKQAIDEWLNPQLFSIPALFQTPLSEKELVAVIRQHYPGVRVGWVTMPERPARSALLAVGNWPGSDSSRRINEVFAHPATGEILGFRSTTTPRFSRQEFVPWLYRFHYTLMMKRTGMVLMGIVAIALTIDCFAGLLLTLPRTLAKWRKWRLAWLVRPSRFNFDLHRASGLWTWPVLFVLAVSSVYLNLAHEVFTPAVDWLTAALLPDQTAAQVAGTILEWQFPLHSGTAFGLAGRIIVCVAGLFITALAITGVVITARKLSGKRNGIPGEGMTA